MSFCQNNIGWASYVVSNIVCGRHAWLADRNCDMIHCRSACFGTVLAVAVLSGWLACCIVAWAFGWVVVEEWFGLILDALLEIPACLLAGLTSGMFCDQLGCWFGVGFQIWLAWCWLFCWWRQLIGLGRPWLDTFVVISLLACQLHWILCRLWSWSACCWLEFGGAHVAHLVVLILDALLAISWFNILMWQAWLLVQQLVVESLVGLAWMLCFEPCDQLAGGLAFGWTVAELAAIHLMLCLWYHLLFSCWMPCFVWPVGLVFGWALKTWLASCCGIQICSVCWLCRCLLVSCHLFDIVLQFHYISLSVNCMYGIVFLDMSYLNNNILSSSHLSHAANCSLDRTSCCKVLWWVVLWCAALWHMESQRWHNYNIYTHAIICRVWRCRAIHHMFNKPMSNVELNVR